MSDDTLEVEVVEAPAEEIEITESQAAEPAAEEKPEPAAEKPKAEDDDEPLPKGVQKRIDRAVRRQYEAEAEAKYLREQNARLQEQKQQPETPAKEAAPTPDQYAGGEYDPEFIKALAKHEAKQELQQQFQQIRQQAEQERAQAARIKSAESWNEKLSKATAELPDFADVVGSSSVPMPEHVEQFVRHGAENGPKLAYYLASHPDEAEQIATQHPLAAIRSLMRIEDKLTTPVKKATDTPAPITPVGSKAKSEKDPSDMTFSEFKEYRRKQIAKRR